MSSKQRDSQPVSALRNLGPKSAMILVEAGISTLDELRELGAVKAYVWVKSLRPKLVSFDPLWALAAGLEDRDWHELDATEKESLLAKVGSLRH